MTMRVGLRYVRRVIAKIAALTPAANSYDDLVGKIWMPESQGYDAGAGRSYLSDPSADVTPQWGGAYDNRT